MALRGSCQPSAPSILLVFTARGFAGPPGQLADVTRVCDPAWPVPLSRQWGWGGVSARGLQLNHTAEDLLPCCSKHINLINLHCFCLTLFWSWTHINYWPSLSLPKWILISLLFEKRLDMISKCSDMWLSTCWINNQERFIINFCIILLWFAVEWKPTVMLIKQLIHHSLPEEKYWWLWNYMFGLTNII